MKERRLGRLGYLQSTRTQAERRAAGDGWGGWGGVGLVTEGQGNRIFPVKTEFLQKF